MTFHKSIPTTQLVAGENKLIWLQVLRGIAALMVLFFHMAPHWALAPPLDKFVGVMHFGFVGVDIFFILSGFVVYASAQNARAMSGILKFAKNRTLRIYLGYWPALLVTAVGSSLILNFPMPTLERMIGSIFLVYPSLFDNWLPTAWSLTYELYFYSWVIFIILFPVRNQQKLIIISICILIIWNVFWLITERQNVYGGGQPLRFALTGYGVEFLIGALINDIYKKFKDKWPKSIIMVPICLLLMCYGMAIGTTSIYFDRVEIMRSGSFGIFATGLFLLILTFQINKNIAPKWLVLVGDASFSLYLLHTFFLGLAGLFRFSVLQGNDTLILVFSLFIPIVIAIISIFWFKYIEYPLMRLILHR